ncbi:MAG: hypothetical protein JW900_08180 [Anaerolineae bacterium]|nr:hypothetical protein [Anaerolineae bacterium]
MKRKALQVTLGLFLLLALTTTTAWAAPMLQGGDSTSTDDLWLTLAPLIALATSIERVLEVLWERWEKKDIWPNKDGVADNKDSSYVEKKRLRSHVIGTLIAIVAIGLTNVRFFHLLGLDVLFAGVPLFDLESIGGILNDFTLGSLVDWVMTAGIIGWGGTELTHSIIEGLVKGRNLWKEMREVQAGERSILEVDLFNEMIAPRLEEMGVSVTTLQQMLTTLESAGVPVDDFIAAMTAGKAREYLEGLDSETSQAVLTLLEGTPVAKGVELPDFGVVVEQMAPNTRQLGSLLSNMKPDVRKRMLGA